MKANAPEKIYIQPNAHDGWFVTNTLTKSLIEYTRTDAFIEKAKEGFCKAMCNGQPPRSICTSLGTCKKHNNFVKFMKGE